ncbi:undecaprenyl-diphosphatase [Bartonella ancashensis]|uniref:undecaprenyl-diphosphatase n=1 Tax=Bartonella ancashensis TaxID=1318743 RepID=UPI0039E44A21
MSLAYQIDVILFKTLAGDYQTWPVFAFWGILCAKFLVYSIPLHLVFLWFCGGRAERYVVLSVCASIAMALFLGYCISLIYFRPRPFVTHLTHSLIQHRATASFPSHHALIFASYAFCLYFHKCKTSPRLALISLIFVCWGRVFVGVHYPLDVLAAAILGYLVSFIIVKFVVLRFPKFLCEIPPLRYNLRMNIHSE